MKSKSNQVILFGWMVLGLVFQAALADEGKKDVKTLPQVFRYIAWIEGDLQNDYEPDRAMAAERLGKWEGGVPEKTDADQYLAYLTVLDASGNKAEAEKKIKDYLVVFPSEKRAIFLLAVHYLRERKMELARYFLLQLEKDSAFEWKSLLFNNMGMIALQERNRDEAMSYFERAIKENPPIAAPLVNLGALYLQSHSYVAAERVFSKAVDIDNRFEDAVLGLGGAYEAQGKYEAAHNIYSKYIDDNPGVLSVLYNESLVLGNFLERRSEASELMLRYIQRGGKQAANAQKMMENWR